MVKYRHLFNKHNPFGGLTLVYESSDNYVTYQYSICSDKDHYCRKIGIETATNKTYFTGMFKDNGDTPVEAILRDLLHTEKLPKHAVYTILRELDTIAYIKFEKTCDRNRKLVLKNKKGEFDE